MKNLIFLALCSALLQACGQPKDQTENKNTTASELPAHMTEEITRQSTLTSEQQAAFDALNRLQVNTDKKNRLYSTFPGIEQSCYPPDTSLTISQADFLYAMKQFVKENCKNMPVDERDELAATAVLAQKEYELALCIDKPTDVTYENGVPRIGTWIIPDVLEQRDVIIVW